MNRSLARSTIYNTLSLCFTYPNEGVFSWIAEGKWVNQLRASLGLLNEEGFEKTLRSFEEIFSGKREGLSLELAREYTRLFVNAFPRVVAPPYGAVYLEKDGLVFGKSTSEVLRFYQDMGFGLKENIGDLPDHVAHELEFMGILTGQEAQASGGEKVRLEEVQISFLSRFIVTWVPVFSEKVAAQSRSNFYRTLSDLTKEFINSEKNYLGIPEEIDPPKTGNPGSEEVENVKTLCHGHRS
ncbi:MAG: hypothetical protein EHM36_00785 [Deltaproteobacteria bacterium]|nr:MAG: hypothetical protein EHM36_00785 [Deltaproteobacteria bacterium]